MPESIGAWVTRLGRWVRLHPVVGTRGHALLARELISALQACGLTVTRHAHSSGDLLIARTSGMGPLLGVYNHYDVELGGRTDPLVTGDRVFGRGVADNLGPLALRISVLERFGRQPNLLWVIEPGEEVGSHALASWLGAFGAPEVDLWLDETGYFDVGGEQRILAIDTENRWANVLNGCAKLSTTMGRPTRIERRRLRRVIDDAAYNVSNLFRGSPYIALGPNDDHSDVHEDNESLPLDNIELSMLQFELLLSMSSHEIIP